VIADDTQHRNRAQTIDVASIVDRLSGRAYTGHKCSANCDASAAGVELTPDTALAVVEARA
jgi:hypothetical protein